MIEELLNAYRSGTVERTELFIALVRYTNRSDWNQLFDAMSNEDQAAFVEWTLPLKDDEVYFVIGEAGVAFSTSDRASLRNMMEERGLWSKTSS